MGISRKKENTCCGYKWEDENTCCGYKYMLLV